MRILIVAATDAEVGVLVRKLGPGRPQQPRLVEYACGGHDVQVLVTGVGMAAAAAWCSRTLAEHGCDLAFNVGLCGSFDRSLAPGRVVHVVSDCFAELGAEDGDRFLTLHDLGLEDRTDARLGGSELQNASPPAIAPLDLLPKVRGITVSTAHGHEASIAAVVARLQPQVESMEGAAFMYACLMHGVPFAQIRAVSNVVERRNRSAWKVEEAIEAAGSAALEIVGAA
jgi:futalosine hydrolase